MLCRVERCGRVWGPAGQVSEKQEAGVGSRRQVKGETNLVKVKITVVVHQVGMTHLQSSRATSTGSIKHNES